METHETSGKDVQLWLWAYDYEQSSGPKSCDPELDLHQTFKNFGFLFHFLCKSCGIWDFP